MRHICNKAYTLISALTLTFVSANAQSLLSPDNIDETLRAMTLEEKAMIVVGANSKMINTSSDNVIIGNHADKVPGAAGMTRPIPRLGIPATILTDGPAGVRIEPHRQGDSQSYFCTGFPIGTALACTWNSELVEEIGRCIGNEALEYGCDLLLGPGMNIHRSPLCGRNFEYYSEDPVVTGKTAAAYVRGVQSQGVGTTLKHFAGNSQETSRMSVDEVISQRALREIYLKGFEIAVREAQPWCIMSSYNRLNGPYTMESRDLLTTILRDEWGYNGFVVTDWIGQRNTAAEIHAGNDLMEPGELAQCEEIITKVKSGELSESDLDTCVKRILQYIVKTPSFKGYAYTNKPNLRRHAEVTRRSATEGMVLLKNDNNTLPMNSVSKIALFGATSYGFVAGGSGSGDVNKAYTIDMVTGLEDAGYEINSKLAKIYTDYRSYLMSIKAAEPNPYKPFWGTIVLPEAPMSNEVIKVQADETDIAVITLGRQSGEGMDRTVDDFKLSDTERSLIEDVCAAFHLVGKKVVVVINAGNVIETASWKSLPDAILLSWQPGQEGGSSVADVLSGKANPSGKLTMTWPIAITDIPSSANFPGVRIDMSRYIRQPKGTPKEFRDYTKHVEGINIGYRYFDSTGKPVSYPFGYGLSYTEFAYSRPIVKNDKDGFTAYITVTNTGNVAGKESVQLYVSAPSGGLEKPAKELKSYAKTRNLQPGESETLTFNVSNYDLASYNEATQSWETAAGDYTVCFAASVADVRASAPYRVKKSSAVKCHDVLRPSMPL